MNNKSNDRKLQIEIELFKVYFFVLAGLIPGTISLLLLWINETIDFYHNKIISMFLIICFLLVFAALFIFFKTLYKFWKQLKK